MKSAVKQKLTTSGVRYVRFGTLLALASIFVLQMFMLSAVPRQAAASTISELEQRTQELEQQVEENQSILNNLNGQIDTLNNRVAQLDAEINLAQTRIDQTENEIARLDAELKQTEAELERQRDILNETLITLYIEGDVSTVDLVFASESFGEFFQEQKYLEQLKASVQDSADRVQELKVRIQNEKDEQEILLQQIEDQRQNLAAKRAEQNTLLERTRGEEAAYQNILAENQAALEEAKQQLIAAIAATQTDIVYGGTGGYPWAGTEPWSFASCYPDPWGMCQRQCVSYTAWKVHRDYVLGKVRFDMPFWGGIGNAYEWPRNARNYGIPTGTTPKAGAIAIQPGVACTGTFCYGHSMYVEAVLPNGNIWVSQMNAQAQGLYSEAEVNPAGLEFIYFQEW